MREVYAMLDSREVYLVPNFISEGYFCQEVLPRELRVAGPVTETEGKVLYYCDPVGIHPNMTKLLLQRADEVAPGVPRSETSLIIVGHGTSLNENSRKVIEQQVALIRDGGYGFAEVIDTYMEEKPLVNDWHTLTTSPNVVVVPFFIADGLHSYQDIPVLLGMEAEVGAAASQREVFRHNPHQLQGRNLYYSGAIGTEVLMAEIVLDQVIEFDRKHAPPAQPAAEVTLVPWLQGKLFGGTLRIGQVQVTGNGRGFELRHLADEGTGNLTVYEGWQAARDLCKLDAEGQFRAWKTAPNLKRGWQLNVPDIESVRLALDIFYPAAIGLAKQEEEGLLRPVQLRENLARQTGMYRFANGIRDDQANEMVVRCCDTQTKCLRRITWGITPDLPLGSGAESKVSKQEAPGCLPLLCVEVCPHLVGEARKIARENHNQTQA